MKALSSVLAAAVMGAVLSAYQAPPFSNNVRGFVKHAEPEIVLTNARVIDGTGQAPSEDQTIVIRNGIIAEIAGSGAKVNVAAGAMTIDLSGKTVLPGLVMFHEHLYYPTGGGVYAQLGASFSRLYLAGGVTTMRTGGNVNGVMDLKLKQEIEAGRQAGPAIDATGLTPLEAIQVVTLNGAKYLGRDRRIGSIAVNKQADLLIVNGNPATNIGDIRNVETVFKQGIGFDPVKLVESVRGRVGLW